MPRDPARGRLGRSWPAISLAIVVLIGQWLILNFTVLNQTNENNAGEHASDNHQECGKAQRLAVTIHAAERVACVFVFKNLRFIDRYHDTLNAISTLAVAIFTATLWTTTYKLWKAGEDQGNLSREVAERQLRAYVSVEKFVISPHLAQDGSVEAIEISVALINRGQTPTKNMISHASVWFEPTDIAEDFRFPDMFMVGRPQTISPAVLAPGDGTTRGAFPFSLFQMQQVRRNEWFLYVYGWVDYDDVFPKTLRHRTEFCARIICPGDPANIGERNIAAEIYWKHNGMDDECMRIPTTKVVRERIPSLNSTKN